jgi:hypothetical protein
MYWVVFIIIVAVKISQKQINKMLKKVNLNNPTYVLILVAVGIFIFRMESYLMLILCSSVIFIFLKSNFPAKEKYFLLYSLIFLSIIPFIIKPYFRNVFPCIPIMIVIASSIVVRLILRCEKYGKEYKSFVMTVVLMFTLFSVVKVAGIQSISYNGYLRELIKELENEKYDNGNVFVEYNHSPVLFYTDLPRLFYIWNINPRYFETTSEKYFLILEPYRNPSKCQYYYRKYPLLVRKCEADPQFYLGFALGEDCKSKVLQSGVRIVECN